jgi:uncharacterized protein (UPF0261 family)
MDKEILLIGTLDTKGQEFEFLKNRLTELGIGVIVMDGGVLGTPGFAADITRDSVAAEGGIELAELQKEKNRGKSMEIMENGARKITGKLFDNNRISGIMGIGGGSGTSLGCAAMRILPIGFPKIMVSTVASGDTRSFVGEKDIMMVYSVADILGLNRVTRAILDNAATAMAGIIKFKEKVSISEDKNEDFNIRKYGKSAGHKPLIAASMMGVTTPCITIAKEILEKNGFEIIAFHSTGSGGNAMENLINDGLADGVMDVTTTEIINIPAGGVFPADEGRMINAGRQAIPLAVSCGALDFVNFWTGNLPGHIKGRKFLQHNPVAVLMRTSKEENLWAGREIARRLNKAKGPAAVFIPLDGFSAYDAYGMPFYDPETDAVFIRALEENLAPFVEIIKCKNNINDPDFVKLMAGWLMDEVRKKSAL